MELFYASKYLRLLLHSEIRLGVAASVNGLAVDTVGNKAASETERGFVGMDEEGVKTVGIGRHPIPFVVIARRKRESVYARSTFFVALPRQLPRARERPVIVLFFLPVRILLLAVDGDEFAGLPFAHSRESPVCAER